MADDYRPPTRRRRFAVWVVGFVVTGKVFHHVSERDVRQLTAAQVAVHAASMCLVVAAVVYALAVVPGDLASTVGVVALGVAAGLGGLPMLVQWLGTKVLELWQLRRTGP